MKTSNERTESIKNKVKAKRRKRTVIWASVTACVLVLTVVCSLPILGGAPNVNAYKNDEYFPIIEKINSHYSDNKYSIFRGVIGNVMFKGATAPAPPPMEDASVPTSPDIATPIVNNGYEETTLNQVEGVIEGDVLKRSTSHAFYLKNSYVGDEPCLQLQVYRLAGSDTSLVSETYVFAEDNTSFRKYNSFISAEMFLNADATRLTIFAPCMSTEKVLFTTVISLDVSDVNAITEANRVYVSGAYVSARKVDGKLLVITNFSAGRYGNYGYNKVDYDKKETYIPQCGSELNSDFISIQDIYVPNNCQSVNYTVLAVLDEKSLEVDDSYAVFSYTEDVFVSRDYIVIARNNLYSYAKKFDYGNELTSDKSSGNSSLFRTTVCEMVALKYRRGIEKLGEIGVEGGVKDRYSMDEKDGVLRVFTTVNQYSPTSTVNVSLHCVDLNTMKILASKERFAPSGDEVKSARFDGDKAYVCTARRNTDPVFYFDLSDLNNITYVDTGEMEGFSTNLVKFNDLLLGIGQGEYSGILKVELYAESDGPEAENGVVSVAKFERECIYSYEPKAHFVNAEHSLIGLHIFDFKEDLVSGSPTLNQSKYLLLYYDAESSVLQPLYLDSFDSNSDYARAFFKDNGVYVFGTNDFTFIVLSAAN